jgi:hypothetical protein
MAFAVLTSNENGADSLTDINANFALAAPLASPAFTGTPSLPTGATAVTQSAGNNSTKLATTAYVDTADALKAPLASPTFTGTPTLPTGTIATTQAALDSSTKVATTAFVMGEKRGYTLQCGAATLSPLDASTYYFGGAHNLTLAAGTEGLSRIYIPKAGTVKAVYLYFTRTGTQGSSEQSTVSFRLNATTDTTIVSTLQTDNASGFNAYSNAAMSVAVVAGDFFELKWVTPTWTTNPTTVRLMATVYIE